MNDHKVNKVDLLARIKSNREEHREQFEKAQGVYRAKVIELLDQRLAQARSGGKIDLYFRMPEPQLFLGEYDAAIAALQWEVEDEIVIDHQTFRELVLNQWGWAQQWAASTQVYLGDQQ